LQRNAIAGRSTDFEYRMTRPGHVRLHQDPVSTETLVALWAAQDSLLQQYRAVFIAIQAALLSAAGLMVGTPARTIPFLVLTTVALLLLPVWVSTCRKRAALTQAAQYLLAKAEAGHVVTHPVDVLRIAQSGDTWWLAGDSYVDDFEPPTKLARVVFERAVPLVFLIAWTALLWAHLRPPFMLGAR
jgi:hypothetical protein